jgi:hypothetical protein
MKVANVVCNGRINPEKEVYRKLTYTVQVGLEGVVVEVLDTEFHYTHHYL